MTRGYGAPWGGNSSIPYEEGTERRDLLRLAVEQSLVTAAFPMKRELKAKSFIGAPRRGPAGNSSIPYEEGTERLDANLYDEVDVLR